MSALMASSVKGKYSAVTLSIRLVFVDLHVMVLYIHTFFIFLNLKGSLAESVQLHHEFPGEI